MGKHSDKIDSMLQNPYIYRFNQLLYRYYSASEILNNTLRDIRSDEKVAIWGGGMHTCHIFKLLSFDNVKKIQFIIDKEIKEDIYNLKKQYVDPSTLDKSDVDVILISAFARKAEIKNEIEKLNGNIKVIDVYNMMFNQGLNVETEFYSQVDYSYMEISDTLKIINECQDIRDQGKMIKKLIAEYLHIRDFANAFHYIDLLQDTYELDKEFYYELKTKISQEMQQIKENIDNSEHILINWIDALRPEEACNMEFLSMQKKKGMFFSNAHTVTPYTSATLKTIFTGKKYLDDYLYKIEGLKELEDTRLYQLIVENGYDFQYFGAKGAEGIFYNPSTIVYYAIKTVTYQIPSTIWQWEALSKMEDKAQKPLLIIIHNLAETHWPNMNGIQAACKALDEKDIYRVYRDEKEPGREGVEKQIKQSQEYLDKQLLFYYELYKNIRYHIYMSDHGQYRGEQPVCLEGHTHVFFLLLGKNIKNRMIEKMFSLLFFPELLEKLLQNKVQEIEDLCTHYVEVQSDDCYSIKTINRYVVNPEAYKHFYVQHRGVITREDAYVKMITGEEYYLRKDMVGNLIEELKFKERIKELKDITGNRFIDIYKEDKYTFSRELYKMLQIQVSEKVAFLQEDK